MKVTINGKEMTLSEGCTLGKVLEERSLLPETLLVEYNGETLKRESVPGLVLKEGDQLELVRFVGGG